MPSSLPNIEKVEPTHAVSPVTLERAERLPPSARERLHDLVSRQKEEFGQDFDPAMEIARIGYAAKEAGDVKTALTAFSALADRLYPKLKAYEIDLTDERETGVRLKLSGLGIGFDTATEQEIEDAEIVFPSPSSLSSPPDRRDLMGDDTS